MNKLKKQMDQLASAHRQTGKISQKLLIIIALLMTVLVAIALFFTGKKEQKEANEEHAEEAEHGHDEAEKGADDHEQSIALTAKQMTEQGVKLASVEMGEVIKTNAYPAKLSINTDRQAHVSPSFSGHVESVNVELGQKVQKGQLLATLLVPDLVDQQANLQIAQTNLTLARQDYQREQQLWSQGISAKQDYQRAFNAYKQAEIQVQAAKSRLSAFGATTISNGRYALKAPISGVISKKDLVVGENVQLADQLFTINQLDQLWLEFTVPSSEFASIAPNQMLEFKSLQTGHLFKAQIQSLNSEADAQTGRLQVRAKVLSNAAELRPNLMVNVVLTQNSSAQALRIQKTAIQQIEGKNAVFVSYEHDGKMEFEAQVVELGQVSLDGQWIEIKSGLTQGQKYVAQGSFLLKSELEKGEASHEH
ncbi:efflux RND transporter periplasmic adaptor subunit [Acinetobacter gerneri]|uniref:Efflux RND transporter periplasmic adaptor subunit n=1 Tax=Acinetobacter gerneri TaxID=202952 RepID=A0AAW8JI97_9GAMM|nr:efflux RND transporter periplasmic adaptor subunit [Acinetobacter gerneri]MDQ9008557.1 efflux RND transporter periplasmic adaptor subunit [Acinetobacter gerneri]MDQ9012478.1 efflux RND transporter periplasmic adaptor subunit [Acinetobacter gerneri]MDQ9023913.1 efflux RND transporter periplasmic adaptor subunit [Acinetobacter gerneri]MDQ9051125.1 efflux RND transporter periplasmic adaptor subunit [Acinetobacter gerneri]MDQ9058373.1 efflux RND transporter periplasmic adaptor subunit [Acinetob